MSKIHDDNLALSDKIKAELQYKDGHVSAPKDLYYTLAEAAGVPKEQIDNVQKFNASFMPSAAHAFGHMAVDVLKDNKDLPKIEASIGMADKDTLDMTLLREKTSVNPRDTANPITTNAYLQVSHNSVASDRGRGQMKAVRSAITEYGTAAFAALGGQ